MKTSFTDLRRSYRDENTYILSKPKNHCYFFISSGSTVYGETWALPRSSFNIGISHFDSRFTSFQLVSFFLFLAQKSSYLLDNFRQTHCLLSFVENRFPFSHERIKLSKALLFDFANDSSKSGFHYLTHFCYFSFVIY